VKSFSSTLEWREFKVVLAALVAAVGDRLNPKEIKKNG
jgi:hypothetical protein